MTRPRWMLDPVTPSLLLFGAVAVAGLVSIGLGWRVAARTLYVALQTPAVVSGGIGGLALVGVGTWLAVVQVGRRLAAEERVRTAAVLEEAGAILDVLRKEQA